MTMLKFLRNLYKFKRDKKLIERVLEVSNELKEAKKRIKLLSTQSSIKNFKPLKVSNVAMYHSIRNIPAWNYFHFAMYLRLFEASSGQIMRNATESLNNVILRLNNAIKLDLEQNNLKEDVIEIVKQLENKKIGFFNALSSTSNYYHAFACLIYKLDSYPTKVQLTNENELFNLALLVDNISAIGIIEEIRKLNDTFNDELLKNFPTIFKEAENSEIQEFKELQNEVLRINLFEQSEESLEFNLHTIERIHRIFYNRTNSIEVNPNLKNDYVTEYLKTITSHYQGLGYTENDLKQISIYEFYAKHRKTKEDIQAMKKVHESAVKK